MKEALTSNDRLPPVFSPQRFFLDAPKQPPGTAFVLDSDFRLAMEEIERLQLANKARADWLSGKKANACDDYIDEAERQIAGLKATIERLRAAHETRAHPEHRCERCRGPNVRWFAPSPLWNAAHGEWDILCPICFVQLAEAAGIDPTAWQIAPEVLPVKASAPTIDPDQFDGNGREIL